MNSYSFDIRGYLQPKVIVEMTFDDFEAVFVSTFEDSRTRSIIFQEFKRYTNDLKETLKSPFIQWIDGSFVNNRTLNPNDIDLVTIIEDEIYRVYESEIDNRFSKYSVNKFYEKLDAYTVRSYPKTHKFHEIYAADYAYWHEWFSLSKVNRAKQRFEKGFIQLKLF